MKKKSNNWIRFILIFPFSLMCIICFLYYTVKFYNIISVNKELLLWILFGLVLLITMILGIINSIKLCKIQKENSQLKGIIEELIEKSNSHYYSTLEYIQNSREISLDVLNELREKP